MCTNVSTSRDRPSATGHAVQRAVSRSPAGEVGDRGDDGAGRHRDTDGRSGFLRQHHCGHRQNDPAERDAQGISATSDALTLTLLGESDVAVYDGSLQEWTNNPELPLEVG